LKKPRRRNPDSKLADMVSPYEMDQLRRDLGVIMEHSFEEVPDKPASD